MNSELRDAAEKPLLAASDRVLRFLDLLREELIAGVEQKQRDGPLERTKEMKTDGRKATARPRADRCTNLRERKYTPPIPRPPPQSALLSTPKTL